MVMTKKEKKILTKSALSDFLICAIGGTDVVIGVIIFMVFKIITGNYDLVFACYCVYLYGVFQMFITRVVKIYFGGDETTKQKLKEIDTEIDKTQNYAKKEVEKDLKRSSKTTSKIAETVNVSTEPLEVKDHPSKIKPGESEIMKYASITEESANELEEVPTTPETETTPT